MPGLFYEQPRFFAPFSTVIKFYAIHFIFCFQSAAAYAILN